MKFRAQCNSVRSLISKKPNPHFLSNLVTESSANPRTLWKTLNTILHRNPSHFQSPQMRLPLPTHSLTFSKIKLIASAPNFYHLIPLIRFFFHLPRLQRLINFIPATLTEIHKFISASGNKQCPWIPSQLSF